MTKKAKNERTYTGYRATEKNLWGDITTKWVCVRVVDFGHDAPLNPRFNIRNHSPTGFEWGYGGSGPAQLALALVVDACGEAYAEAPIYQRFKAKVVAALPKDGWVLTVSQVRAAVELVCEEQDWWPALDPEDDYDC
jgi:hypothetical protein